MAELESDTPAAPGAWIMSVPYPTGLVAEYADLTVRAAQLLPEVAELARRTHLADLNLARAAITVADDDWPGFATLTGSAPFHRLMAALCDKLGSAL